MKRFLSTLTALVLSITLAACATGPSPGEMEIRQGTIEQINATEIKNSHAQGIGAVLGAAAGLGIGSLIGAGTGRDVAMVLGTLGGAAGGYEVAKNYDKPTPAQQIFVRLKNGVLVSVTQPTNASLRVGQRVYIEGTGHEARVMSQ
jgi:outer membrane lipoprotein SlyB